MKQLDPNAMWLFFWNYVITRILILVIFSVVIYTTIGYAVSLQAIYGNGGMSNIKIVTSRELLTLSGIIVFILFLIFHFFWAKLTYHFYKYELTENSFRKEHGVIYKKYITIPYDRIQNVDIYRGILARILGLSDLNIQTAGISGIYLSEGRLPGLSKEVAEELRDELIRRVRQSKNQGL